MRGAFLDEWWISVEKILKELSEARLDAMKTYQCLCEDNQLDQCTKCISVLMIWSINSVLFEYALLHDIPDNTNYNPLVFGTQ